MITSVETVTPLLPSARTNSTVASDEARILTILLPIRIDESSVSYFSASFRTFAARASPSEAMRFRRTVFSDV